MLEDDTVEIIVASIGPPSDLPSHSADRPLSWPKTIVRSVSDQRGEDAAGRRLTFLVLDVENNVVLKVENVIEFQLI